MAKSTLKGSTALTAEDADPIRSDFRNFLFLVWEHLNLPVPTPLQYDAAYWLQHGPRRQVIEAFRGVGKSWVTAAFVLWLLLNDPQRKIMVVSASKARADGFSTFVLRLIQEMPILHHLRPGADQRSSKVEFDVGPARPDQSPSVKSVGITGQLTGSRADWIVADDIEVPGNSATQMMRDKLSEAVKEFDAVLKPGGRVVYLGTPQTEQSLYNQLAERGYVIRIWPALYPTPEQREKYGPKLAPFITNALDKNPALAGTPTDPKRFSMEDLEERRLSYGRQGFALQFMLDTSLSDADRYPLKLRDLIVHPLDPLRAPVEFVWAAGQDQVLRGLPAVGLQGDYYHRPGWVSAEYAEYEGSVMFVDPSGRGKDEVAWAVVKALHGRLFLTAIGGRKDGYGEETLKTILLTAKRQGVNLILHEPNYGGGMFGELLKGASQRYYPVSIEEAEWARGQKEPRIIDTLEPVLAQHRLVVDLTLIEDDYKSTEGYQGDDVQRHRLFYQLTRLTSERGALAHDDRVEALAGAVAYWQGQMARDTEKAVIAHKGALQDAALERFMAHVIGPKESDHGWASGLMRGLFRGGR